MLSLLNQMERKLISKIFNKQCLKNYCYKNFQKVYGWVPNIPKKIFLLHKDIYKVTH